MAKGVVWMSHGRDMDPDEGLYGRDLPEATVLRHCRRCGNEDLVDVLMDDRPGCEGRIVGPLSMCKSCKTYSFDYRSLDGHRLIVNTSWMKGIGGM
jgi:hypothetical protein